MRKLLSIFVLCFALPYVWGDKVYAHHIDGFTPLASEQITCAEPFDHNHYWIADNDKFFDNWWFPCHTFVFHW